MILFDRVFAGNDETYARAQPVSMQQSKNTAPIWQYLSPVLHIAFPVTTL